MPKTTRTLSGASRDKYFRELFAAEPELPRDAAQRLLKVCAREISQVRVREPLPARASLPAADIAPAGTAPPTGTTEAPDFDPYAFSLVAFFKRSGREALLARLASIESVVNLRRLAEAQHIALPGSLHGLAELRAAIVDGTEQRLADRRAAAS